jgi:hypothetical protein
MHSCLCWSCLNSPYPMKLREAPKEARPGFRLVNPCDTCQAAWDPADHDGVAHCPDCEGDGWYQYPVEA